jgi:Zn-finger nucleic acid-binding protein
MNCPICNVTLLMAEKQGIEIDYCPQCRGIWLDRGELEKIIEKSAQVEVRDDRDYRGEKRHYDHDDHHDSHDYKYKRKRGFLGDMFDF